MSELDKFYKFIKKNQGRNFVNFLIKQRDEMIKNSFIQTFDNFFGEFSPDINKFNIAILASGKYAQNIISINSELEILIVFKEIAGYNTKPFLKALEHNLLELNLNLKIKTIEISNIFNYYKDDIKLKSSVSIVRYIYGSKMLYKSSRDEFARLKSINIEKFLTYHTSKFLPLDSVPFLEQEPNLKSSYGGIDEIYSLNCIISTFGLENQARLSIKNILDEKQISQFNLSMDFLLSIKSVINLVNDEDIFSEKNIDKTINLMQTKSKKAQETNVRISQKTLSCMRNIALIARYLISSLLRPNINKMGFLQKRVSKHKSGFYIIQNTIYTPTHKKIPTPNAFLDELNLLGDLSYKFDISTIFYIKKIAQDSVDMQKISKNLKKILAKNNSYCILKAMLDAEILGTFIKPMENIIKLAKYDGYHKFSVDEHSILSVYHLENIKDKFIKSIYNNLCLEAKVMLKLVALMHDVGKGVEGDHAVVGSNIFRAYANKLELNSNAVNIGVLLIRYHNLMSDVANTEDIYSQRTIFSFISKLTDKKVLEMLYILSYCIINSTNENLYTPYISKLLRKLYDISYQSFDDENLLDEATRRVKKEQSIRRNDEFERLDESIKEKIFEISSNLLFAKHSVGDIIAITKRAYECDSLDFNMFNNQNLNLKIISNHDINLSALLVVLANFDLAYMEIYELFDNKFFIRLEFNKNIKSSEMLNLKAKAVNALSSIDDIEVIKPIIKKDEISFDINHSAEYARLNINAKDQRGLMAYVMRLFFKANLKIVSAKIQTIKNRTRNLFLISKNSDLCYNFDKITNQLISE